VLKVHSWGCKTCKKNRRSSIVLYLPLGLSACIIYALQISSDCKHFRHSFWPGSRGRHGLAQLPHSQEQNPLLMMVYESFPSQYLWCRGPGFNRYHDLRRVRVLQEWTLLHRCRKMNCPTGQPEQGNFWRAWCHPI